MILIGWVMLFLILFCWGENIKTFDEVNQGARVTTPLHEKKGRNAFACSTNQTKGTSYKEQGPQQPELQDEKKVPIIIPTYFHILQPEKTQGELVPEDIIQKQLKVLNNAFSQGQIQFQYVATSVTEVVQIMLDTFTLHTQSEYQIKKLLRRGGSEVLNIYVLNWKADDLLGYGTLPEDYGTNPMMDGVVLHYRTLPGWGKKGIRGYSLGKTAIHEVGHWLGLSHIIDDKHCGSKTSKSSLLEFQNSNCSFGYINNNFMNFGNDVSMTQFTLWQLDKMRTLWFTYRYH